MAHLLSIFPPSLGGAGNPDVLDLVPHLVLDAFGYSSIFDPGNGQPHTADTTTAGSSLQNTNYPAGGVPRGKYWLVYRMMLRCITNESDVYLDITPPNLSNSVNFFAGLHISTLTGVGNLKWVPVIPGSPGEYTLIGGAGGTLRLFGGADVLVVPPLNTINIFQQSAAAASVQLRFAYAELNVGEVPPWLS
jgi:hypothetical protein